MTIDPGPDAAVLVRNTLLKIPATEQGNVGVVAREVVAALACAGWLHEPGEVQFEPARPWRVIYADGRRYDNGELQVWAESSNEREVRERLKTCPGGGILQRLYERYEAEWRAAPAASTTSGKGADDE